MCFFIGKTERAECTSCWMQFISAQAKMMAQINQMRACVWHCITIFKDLVFAEIKECKEPWYNMQIPHYLLLLYGCVKHRHLIHVVLILHALCQPLIQPFLVCMWTSLASSFIHPCDIPLSLWYMYVWNDKCTVMHCCSAVGKMCMQAVICIAGHLHQCSWLYCVCMHVFTVLVRKR